MWVLRALDADANHPLSFRLMPGAVKTIGRVGAADFCLDVPLVSRLHCRVEVGAEGDVEVVDLDSTNGTWIRRRARDARAARGRAASCAWGASSSCSNRCEP